MKRSELENELEKAGVRLNGWMPVLECAVCHNRWEPFHRAVGSEASTVRLDYWKCPNNCNANAQVAPEVRTTIPRYVVFDDVPGMVFTDQEQFEFERYVQSMAATEIPIKSN